MVMDVQAGKWGYKSNGDFWCTTCGGTQEVPCTEQHTWDPEAEWWASCPYCDVDLDPSDPTNGCPTCNSTDNQANLANYVEGAPMCANCGATKGICKKHPGVVWNGFTGPWCKACCLTCNPL